MTQGSTLPTQAPGKVAELDTHRARRLFTQLKEKSALCKAIQTVAEHCQDAGHVTLDDCETIQYLAYQLGVKLDALAADIAGQ